jgi:hypothetical protein
MKKKAQTEEDKIENPNVPDIIQYLVRQYFSTNNSRSARTNYGIILTDIRTYIDTALSEKNKVFNK